MESLKKDELFLIAIELALPDVLNFCKSSKSINEKVCKNPSFWLYKLNKDFPDYTGSKEDPKNIYFILSKKYRSPDKIISKLIKEGKRDLAIYLIEKYKDPTKINKFVKSLKNAAAKNDHELVDLLLKYKAGVLNVVIRGYAKAGNLEFMEYYIYKTRRGLIDFDKIIKTAIKYKHSHIIDFLVENKLVRKN